VKEIIGIILSMMLIYGCCASTAKTETNDAAEQAAVDAVLNSTCVKDLTIWRALYIDARDHIGKDAKWYGFAIKSSTLEGADYKVFINWENGEEKYGYKFTYNPATKEIASVNKEARLVLDICRR